MLCKKCGKELPISGKFCPFCGAETEQVGVNDETTAFQPPVQGASDDALAPSQTINVSDLDAAIQKEITGTISSNTQTLRETRFDDADEDRRTREVTPYKKPGKGKKIAIGVLIVAIIAALATAGVFFVKNRGDSESLEIAERYMTQGKFEEALAAYELALEDAKNPDEVSDKISYLKDYLAAQAAYDSGDYAQALALLSSLSNRLPEGLTKLKSAVDSLTTDVQLAQEDASFANDLKTVSTYIDEGKLDQAAGILDGLEDDELTSSQQKQIKALREQLDKKRAEETSKQEHEQKQQETKNSFSARIDELEAYDRKLPSASTAQESLNLTATSFESWDTLLGSMYDSLETTLNVDAYSSEESAYKSWIEERDNAAKAAYDEVMKNEEDAQSDAAIAKAELAKYSILHSYTRARCYKMLDKI